MASNSSILRPAARLFSAAAAAKPEAARARAGAVSHDVKTSTVPSGIIVASANSLCPVSRVSIAVRAGSRYEKPASVGASHMCRIAAGLGSKDVTQVSIVRNLNQIGATLTCTGSREYLLYDVSCLKDHLPTALRYLKEASVKPGFKPWELSDNMARLKVELALACYSNDVAAVELLHRAAYRGHGLGNSIYAPAYNLGNLNADRMAQFFEETFTGGRMAVVGMGVEHAALEEFAQSIHVSGGQGVSASGKYGGGECRVETGGATATVAVAYEGASWSDQKAAVTAAVLQQALGTGPHVSGGVGAGVLQKAVAKVTADFSVSGLSASYSDSGLVGFLLTANAAEAGKAAKAAQAVLKSSLSDADVARGKAQLSAQVWNSYESGMGFTDGLGEVAVVTGKVLCGKGVNAIIDSVTTSDVNSLLKKAAAGKPSMGAVGNLTTVPYLDEL